jgi:hypothetical protein
LLLGLAALGQRGAGVGRVDERGEVGHVQREGGDVQIERGDGPQGDPPLDLGQRPGPQLAGGVPVAAGVQGRGRDLDQAVPGRSGPPVGEGALGAGVDDPVQRGQRQVGPHRGARVGAPGAGDLVDDLDDSQLLDHAPGRGQVPERQVLCPRGHPGGAGHRLADLGGGAQVGLLDDPGLAVHAGRGGQVVVRVPLDLLADHRWHAI